MTCRGRLRASIRPNGTGEAYTYDALGSVVALVTEDSTLLATYTYNARGLRKRTCFLTTFLYKSGRSRQDRLLFLFTLAVVSREILRSALAVEKVDGDVEVSCEGDPEGIGDLQIGGDGTDAAVEQDGAHDKDKEQKQPDKGEEEKTEAEEENAPKEVDDERGGVGGKAVACGVGVASAVEVDERCADAHEDVEDAPDDGEQNGGRR